MGRKRETTWAGVVARIREHAGGSVYRLARRSHITPTTIHGLLKGTRSPNAETLERLLAAAGLSWPWLEEIKGPALALPKPERDDPKPPRTRKET